MNQSSSPYRRPKRRNVHHLQGERGVNAVRAALPKHWVSREINPDYGLDLHIEAFESSPDDPDGYDALGEHFFAQVKSERAVKVLHIQPFVDEGSGAFEQRDSGPSEKRLKVVSYQVETTLLETVRRMGSAIPVVLFLYDKTECRTYYICLTDWVSKILPGWRENFHLQDTVTVHIPAANVMSDNESNDYFSALALRPKLYGAFQYINLRGPEVQRAAYEIPICYDDYGSAEAQVARLHSAFGRFCSDLTSLDFWGSRRIALLGLMAMSLDAARSLIADLNGAESSIQNEAQYMALCARMQTFEVHISNICTAAKIYEEVYRLAKLPLGR